MEMHVHCPSQLTLSIEDFYFIFSWEEYELQIIVRKENLATQVTKIMVYASTSPDWGMESANFWDQGEHAAVWLDEGFFSKYPHLLSRSEQLRNLWRREGMSGVYNWTSTWFFLTLLSLYILLGSCWTVYLERVTWLYFVEQNWRLLSTCMETRYSWWNCVIVVIQVKMKCFKTSWNVFASIWDIWRV